MNHGWQQTWIMSGKEANGADAIGLISTIDGIITDQDLRGTSDFEGRPLHELMSAHPYLTLTTAQMVIKDVVQPAGFFVFASRRRVPPIDDNDADGSIKHGYDMAEPEPKCSCKPCPECRCAACPAAW